MLNSIALPRCQIVLAALLAMSLCATGAEPEPEPVCFGQTSLPKARVACKDVKFESPKLAKIFGPQTAQNQNIETVVIKVYRGPDRKVSKISVGVIIVGTIPPVVAGSQELPPPMADFSALVERLLLEK